MKWCIIFSITPLAMLIIFLLVKNPYWSLTLLFILNYTVFGLARYILPGLKPGILIDAVIALVLIGLFIHSLRGIVHWNFLKNDLTIIVSIWLVFCVLNLLNPLAPIEAWIIGVRRTALYFFIFPILTFLLFYRYKDFKIIIYIWSFLILLAVLKAFVQKYFGFNAAELKFLYVEGRARTHIIYSGIRYFSFLSDAANFGCAMAFSMVFFSISVLYVPHKLLKIYYVIVSFCAAYGMLLSGTRAAIVIPFVGYGLFFIFSKNTKMIFGGAILLISAFFILNFTQIGQGNTYVRRMRTAFQPTKDASFLVRVENQRKMRMYMANKPFGVGIGTSKASEYSTSEVSKIPTDSWLVMVWTETGIIGLIVYLTLIGYILIKGTYILFKIKNRELWGIECALLVSIAGIYVASYANEVIAQFPNGPIIYMAMAFIFMAEHYDQNMTKPKHA